MMSRSSDVKSVDHIPRGRCTRDEVGKILQGKREGIRYECRVEEVVGRKGEGKEIVGTGEEEEINKLKLGFVG